MDKLWWHTTEHYFQAQKFVGEIGKAAVGLFFVSVEVNSQENWDSGVWKGIEIGR